MKSRLYRNLTTGLLTLGLAMAPIVTLPGLAAHAVEPDVQSLPLAGVDSHAAAELGLGAQSASSDENRPRTVALTPRSETDPFDLVAVTWNRSDGQAEATTVSVRVREKGAWTDWTQLQANDEGPDPDTAEARAARSGTDPLLTTGADGYQVRVDSADGKAPDDLRVQLIDAGRSAADGKLATPAATADAAAGTPAIISRAQWGADESLRSGSPSYTDDVRVGIVHHTASTNSYTADQAAAQVRAMYAYHTATLGWSDIGYNFLVDKYGRIYEGRAGGTSRGVVGAHAGGYNSNTFGVSVVGTYTSTEPPKSVIAALSNVIAWKMAIHSIDPYGASPLTSTGGGTARYPSGDTRRFSNLSGHRDTGHTSCPGDGLYNRLPHLRAAIRAKMLGTVNPGGSAIGDRLNSGKSMSESGFLRSANSQHVLTANGFAGEEFGLVLTGQSCYPSVLNVVGRPAPGRRHGNVLTMQADGNLVLYTNGVATWQTGTYGNRGAYAVLQNDRNLVVYSASGRPLFATGATCHTIRIGASDPGFVRAGQQIASANHAHRLTMQPDGNLVLYGRNRALWNSRTSGNPGAYLAVQADGNLVVYNSAGRPLWASGTSRAALYSDLILQSDGNLVLYTASPGYGAAWATRTNA